MRQFEKDLKLIQSKCNPNTGFVLSRDIDIPPESLMFLKAKGLITTARGYDNIFKIVPTDAGITYFADKADSVKSAVLHWSINLFVAVLSAVLGSVFTLLIQSVVV